MPEVPDGDGGTVGAVNSNRVYNRIAGQSKPLERSAQGPARRAGCWVRGGVRSGGARRRG